MSKCDKCKENEGTECVWYSEYESYLCKPCHRIWKKIDKSLPQPKMLENGTYKEGAFRNIEKKYLNWIGGI